MGKTVSNLSLLGLALIVGTLVGFKNPTEVPIDEPLPECAFIVTSEHYLDEGDLVNWGTKECPEHAKCSHWRNSYDTWTPWGKLSNYTTTCRK